MRISLALVVVLGSLLPSSAQAQTAYGQSTVVLGDGFRISDTGRLHLFANLDFHYDSNVAYQPAGFELGDFVLRLRGGARLDQPSEVVAINAGLVADWTQYLGIFSATTRGLSALQGAADVGLVINRSGKVVGSISEVFSRIDAPTVISISQRLASIRNTARAGIEVKPGAFEFGFSYAFDIILYDPNQTVVVDSSALSVYSHELHAQAEWKFFPKTALTLQVDQWFTRYPSDADNIDADANPFTAKAGLIGQLTDKLVLNLNAGYENLFLSGPLAKIATSNQTVVGTLQLGWRPVDPITFMVGYVRGVLPASLYGWYTYDRPFIEYQQFFAGRLTLALRAAYEYETFGQPLFASAVKTRVDNYIHGEARGTVSILRWLAGSVYYDPEVRLTNYQDVHGFSGSYLRHVVGIDVTFGY